MKTTKKILTLVLALALIFALTAPSFAIVSGNQPIAGDDSYYVQTNTSDYYQSGQFTVYLSINSGKKGNSGPISRVYEVTMGSANAVDQLYTVEDVLTAAHAQNSNLIFSISSDTLPNYNNEPYDTLTGVADWQVAYFVSFDGALLKYGGSSYACGWKFRINGMLPYYTHYNNNNVPKTEGCYISNAYVTADDVIDLYYANVHSGAVVTKVRKIVYETPENADPYFQLLEADCSWDGIATHDWVPSQWAPVESGTISIKYDGTSATIQPGTDGKFSFSVTPGTHTFKVVTEMASYTYGNNNTTYLVPSVAGMYSVIDF
jgi:hypothetical protein